MRIIKRNKLDKTISINHRAVYTVHMLNATKQLIHEINFAFLFSFSIEITGYVDINYENSNVDALGYCYTEIIITIVLPSAKHQQTK